MRAKRQSIADVRRYTGQVSAIDIAKLSAEERLALLDQLWGSLSAEMVPMSDAQKEELDRRLDELDREGPVGIPWNEVLDRALATTRLSGESDV